MSAEEDAERYVREGIPAFVDVYDRLRALVETRGLAPGEVLDGDDALAIELGCPRELVREALLLLEEDGHLVRDRELRCWRVAPPPRVVSFTDSFHHQLGDRARPVRRLLVGIEDGSRWSHELLRCTEQLLVWETVFALDGVLLASTLEMMRLSALLDGPAAELTEHLTAAEHDLDAWPTMLEALGREVRSGLSAEVWRLSQISRATERLAWMELPLHGIPAALTVVLADDRSGTQVPVYLAKNLFDLGSFDLVVHQIEDRIEDVQ